MLTYDMEQRGALPRYDYLYRCIKQDILSGNISSGERLPSKRALAEHLAVSVITVENAYDQLLSEGYISAKERNGYFVNSIDLPPMPEFLPSLTVQKGETEEVKWKYDFASNNINEKYFPFSVWSKLMREVLSCGGSELLRRSPFNGEGELRSAIASYLTGSRGIRAKAENIVIGAGTESLYALLVQLLGRERVYGVENPSYRKIANIYNANGAAVKGIGLDKDGVSMSELYASKATVLHISPAHHYPTGIVTGLGRRSEILHWANKVDGYVIEDDYDSEFRMTGKPIQPMQALDTQGRVIYINTFSKTLAPSIRMGYMLLPDGLMAEFKKRLGFYACAVPNFEQLTMAKFISRGYFDRHLARMRNIYRNKRDEAMKLFLESGHALDVSEENAGLHFLVKLHTDLSDDEVKRIAAERGVRLAFLSDFALSGGENMQHCIVVNYSGL